MAQDLTYGTKVDHELYGEGIIGQVNLTTYDIFFAKSGKMSVSKESDELDIIEEPAATAQGQSNDVPSFDVKEFEHIFRKVLDQYGLLQEEIPLADRWEGGVMKLEPANPDQKGKEIPIETFFHKIVMVRDRLRVLEQNINNNKNLSDAEKVDLQQYITRSYGSLTTFNLLFRDKEDYFTGTSK